MLLPETEQAAVPPSTKEAPGIDVLASILLPLAGPEEYDLDVGFKPTSEVTSTDVVQFTLRTLKNSPPRCNCSHPTKSGNEMKP